MLNLELPWPPTINHYWIQGKNSRRYIGRKGLEFRKCVDVAYMGKHVNFTHKVSITILAYPPDNRKRDLDNILKSLLDALQHAGVIDDDYQVSRLFIVRKEVEKPGKVLVRIRQI